MDLKEKDLNNGIWSNKISIILNEDKYKTFNILLKDVDNKELSNCKCEISVVDNNDVISNIKSDEFGMLPNSLKCKLGSTLKIRVYMDESVDEKEINLDDIVDVAEIIFDKIKVTEEVSTENNEEETKDTPTSYSMNENIIGPRTRLENAEKINTNLYDNAKK